MSTVIDFHARKASARRRRRHVTQLRYRLHLLVPDAATVLVTPVLTDTAGEIRTRHLVTVRDFAGQPLRGLPAGTGARIAALLQGVHPTTDWTRPQTWRADEDRLVEYLPSDRRPVPAPGDFRPAS